MFFFNATFVLAFAKYDVKISCLLAFPSQKNDIVFTIFSIVENVSRSILQTHV